MMVITLFCLILALSQAQLVRTTTELESWTFTADTSVPTACGIVYPTNIGDIYQVIALGSAKMALGVNVSYLENPTSLTLVWTVRDMTTMPEVLLSDVVAAVARNTVVAKISMDIGSAPLLGGVSSSAASVISSYPMGSNDSFGNTFVSGHTWGFEYSFFFNTTVGNQNVTINSNVFFPFYVLW
jgi:hypothetical protein